MATPANAIQIKSRSVPFLTQGAVVTRDNVLGYIASIEGWLWGHPDAPLRGRLNAIKDDATFKQRMRQDFQNLNRNNPNPAGLWVFLLRLDHIAYDIKVDADDEYECTPETEQIPKTLHQTNKPMRDALGELINRFAVQSEGDGATPTHTIVNRHPPNQDYRIDRESLSAAPAPRYWTYRIQTGGLTHGGIELQTNVKFRLNSVRQALRDSLESSGQLAGRFYIRLRAPTWLTEILAA